MSVMLHNHSLYRNNLIHTKKKTIQIPNCSHARPQVQAYISGTSGALLLSSGVATGTAETDRILYFMVFRDNVLACRFCSREPSDMGRTRTRNPLSSMSVLAARCGATLSTRTLLYSRIKTRLPGRAPRKFRSEIHYGHVADPAAEHRFPVLAPC